jgi:hypothetical protein
VGPLCPLRGGIILKRESSRREKIERNGKKKKIDTKGAKCKYKKICV